MNNINSSIVMGSHLPAEQRKAIEAAARDHEQRERARRTELYRREAAKAINRWAREHCKYLAARYDLDDLLPSQVHVGLKKPKSYYDAKFEAAAIMTHDTYLLDRSVKQIIAELFPEACRRAGHMGRLPESVWYDEFTPKLHERVMRLLADFRPTNDCNNLSKVCALIKMGRKNEAADRPIGQDFPQGRFQFNGNGTVCWFGNDLRIQEKGKSRTQYVRVDGNYENIFKTLISLGVDRITAQQWQANAEDGYRQRQRHEAIHDANLESYGIKYD